MDRIEFRIAPRTEQEWRRLREQLLDRPAPWRAAARLRLRAVTLSLPAVVTIVAAVAVIGTSAGEAARVNGSVVHGSRILVVEDYSGSMNTAQDELKRQQALLGKSLLEGSARVQGFGVLSTGWPTNLLHALERELPARRGTNTLCLISDFYPVDVDIDCNDSVGLSRFRQLIRRTGVRLYLSTVNMLPSPGLLSIAWESGGGLIGAAKPASSRELLQSVCGANQ